MIKYQLILGRITFIVKKWLVINSKNSIANNKKLSNIETTIVDQFNNVDGVINASLIAYQNDFGD